MRKTGILCVCVVTMLLAACSQNDAVQVPENPFISEADGAEIAEEHSASDTAVLAELTSPSGSTLMFIDESLSFEGGGVGVLELTSTGQKPFLAPLDKVFEPTALEVYLALAPRGVAPTRLLEAHATSAKERDDVQGEPRQLALGSLQTSGTVGDMVCSDSASFQNAFQFWFYNPGNYAHQGYGLDIIWNNIGTTGVATRRVLAACNNRLHTPFADSTPVEVRVEAQVGADFWPLVEGTLMTLDNEEGMYYLSEGWVSQRYRIVAKGHPWAIYNLAGAWGKKR